MNQFYKIFLCTSMLLPCSSLGAQTLVDLDVSGRNSSEVTEPDYTPWVANTSNTLSVSGITFSLANTSSVGELSSTWYKAGVQSPYYARLVDDGAYIKDGDNTSGLQLSITGLSSGSHSLLLYLNATDDYSSTSLSSTDVYVNGTLTTTVAPSLRATSTSAATTAYVTFSGTSAVIKLLPNTSATVNKYVVYLNGFGLDVPNSALQASNPSPAHCDYHVAADDGSLSLSWTAPSGATSHQLYWGTDSASVASAQTPTATLTSASYAVSGLSNLKIYFWRVDELSGSTVTKGSVWSFRPRHLAFPGAEGYGKYAMGGRGGAVIHVTNLNDSGTGSLRWALADVSGPRTIVFDVAGVIQLQSRLTQQGTNVTLAGQTAPGNGICIKAAPVGVGSESVWRNVRVRLGSGNTYDGLGMAGALHSITDHCSISWTIDEAFSSRNAKYMTLQNTLISEALNIAGHKNYPAGTGHGYAATIGGDVGSFHHNLLAHNSGRNWSMGGGLDGNGYYAGRLDIFNNVVYNWYTRVCDGGAHEVNFVGNYYKRGAASESSNMAYMLSCQIEGAGLGSQAYYYHNNIMAHQDGSLIYNGTVDTLGRQAQLYQVVDWEVFVSKPFFESLSTVDGAALAYKKVLSDVGATQPVLDPHDLRMINETLTGTYACTGALTQQGGIIDSSSESKEDWSFYTSASRPDTFDVDADGMPNWWEWAYGFNPNSSSGDFSESNADYNNDGYTNLEDYLNYMATPHFSLSDGTTVKLALGDYFRGFTSGASYSLLTVPSGLSASLSGSSLSVFGKENGVYYLSVKVSDSDGDSFTRSLAFYVSGIVAGPATLSKQGAGSSSQTVVQDSALVPFSYVWTNATSASVSGLPLGISAVVDDVAKTVSFSGTASDSIGVFTYTITTVGGSPDASVVRIITIIPAGPATLSKRGGGGSSQSVVQDSALVPFSYVWTNANGVTVTGLPSGITCSVNASTRTVSFSGFAHAAVGAYPYTISTRGGSPDSVRTNTLYIVAGSSSLEQVSSSGGYSLYPNPASTSVSVFSAQSHPFSWSVGSLSGRVVLSGTGVSGSSIPLTTLPSGVYLVRIQSLTASPAFLKLLVR